MQLYSLVNKPVFVGTKQRGICVALGVSLKTAAIKYLYVQPENDVNRAFAVSYSALSFVGETLSLKSLRPVFPNACARLSPNAPIYTQNGEFLGALYDIEITENGAVRTLISNKNLRFPFSAVFSCRDAILLRKKQPYPLGQRVPAPALSLISPLESEVVSKRILRHAIQKGNLIKFTLSLLPFDY